MSKNILVLGTTSYKVPFLDYGQVLTNTSYSVNGDYLKQFDFVVFTGGADISPFLYHEKPYKYTSSNYYRDIEEYNIVKYCIEHTIPTVGICRGAQLLTVLNGGKLIQHVTHHPSHHPIKTYNGKEIQVNSLHHQLCVPTSDAVCLGWYDPPYAIYKGIPNNTPVPEKDCEAFWYPKTKCLGVQYHPEMLKEDTEGYKFFQQLLQEFIL